MTSIERALSANAAASPARTVLYVDDEPANVELVQAVLARRPEVTLLVAMQAGTGLELAREHRPALVLLDLHLPDMTGQEVLARLRSDPGTAATRIVVLSADDRPELVDSLIADGADGFLGKPFRLADLLTLVDDAIAGTAAADPPAATAEHQVGALDPVTLAGLQQVAALRPDEGVPAAVATYLVSTGAHLGALRRAADDGDVAGVAEPAHAVAGSSAMFGASVVAALCQEIAGRARDGELTAVRAKVPELEHAFTEARGELEAAFPAARAER
jgi:CheY-like chemotaxis protein